MINHINSIVAPVQQNTEMINHVNAKKDFNAIFESLKQKNQALKNEALLNPSTHSAQFEENLHTRFELAQQDIKREGTKIHTQFDSVKAVVGIVSQDFWRQAFSSAIQEHESSNTSIPLNDKPEITPTQAPSLFQQDNDYNVER